MYSIVNILKLNIFSLGREGLWYEMAKRILDIVVAATALTILALPMLVIAVLIKIDSKGPVMYNAQRYGKDGKIFNLYKFRSLTITQEAIHKRIDDPTVTRVGKVIRKYFIDELPQLINILKGDMSIVGPRPEQKFLVDENYEIYKKRFPVKPGLTGLWQINGKIQPIYENIHFDLEYIEKRSFWFDLKIMIKTIPVLFKGEEK